MGNGLEVLIKKALVVVRLAGSLHGTAIGNYQQLTALGGLCQQPLGSPLQGLPVNPLFVEIELSQTGKGLSSHSPGLVKRFEDDVTGFCQSAWVLGLTTTMPGLKSLASGPTGSRVTKNLDL